MDAETLSKRLDALEASMTEYVLEDIARWQAVHARITAYEIAVELMCNVAQRRDPGPVRDLIEGLAFVEAETRRTNFHDALIGEIRGSKSSCRMSRRPEAITRRSRSRQSGSLARQTPVTSRLRDWAPPYARDMISIATGGVRGTRSTLTTTLVPDLSSLRREIAMLIDRYGTRHSSRNEEAVRAFEKAVHGVAAHRPTTADALMRALWADPDLVAGHALKGFASVILGREELMPAARQGYDNAAAACAAQGGATVSETALLEALDFASRGRLLSAAARLEAHLEDHPTEFLAAKLAHALRFMGGDLRGMLASTSCLVDRFPASAPGYGFLLGCHAFGLEEAGDFEAAERTGRRAVALEPEDAWGIHAVSHVHEMSGRTREGVAWLQAHRSSWSRCNNFSFHLSWHLALFHLERGEHARVLALYDGEVRPHPTDDFRDVANAVSLLWRLEEEGVPVGNRWDELREIALKRRRDMTLTFAALHYLLALVATNETAAAAELVAAIGAKAVSAEGDQATVMDVVGRDLAQVILGFATNGAGRLTLDRLATRLPMIGGSHAQRDVFVRSLAMLAAERGDRAALDRVLAIRGRLKREDRFAALVRGRRAEAQPFLRSA